MEDHGDPHQLMTCPYDTAHQVERYRMHIHLQKCHNQHKVSKKVTCPFDATHIVEDIELEHHVTVCPKRILFDKQAYVMEDGTGYTGPQSQTPQAVPTEENWEDENVKSYTPDPSRIGSHVIKKIKGATPSERRKARVEGVRTFRPKQYEDH